MKDSQQRIREEFNQYLRSKDFYVPNDLADMTGRMHRRSDINLEDIADWWLSRTIPVASLEEWIEERWNMDVKVKGYGLASNKDWKKYGYNVALADLKNYLTKGR